MCGYGDVINIIYLTIIGCPRLVRSDYGTENCYLAASQIALRSRHTDTFAGVKSYRYGKSTTNSGMHSIFLLPFHTEENALGTRCLSF